MIGFIENVKLVEILEHAIKLTRVSENNLKNIDVEIPYHKHTVIVGVSGSGKSTLAYDVIYATAQRKLLDCMADQEKRFNVKMKRPKVGSIDGLSTVISLKQVKPNMNPRSTIGTYTSIGSHIRSLIAIHGQCKCLICDGSYKQSNLFTIVKDLESLKPQTIVEVSFPYFFHKNTERELQIEELRKQGFRYIYVKNERRNLRDFIEIDADIEFIMVVESKFQSANTLNKSDINYIKSACQHGDHFISIHLFGDDQESINQFYKKHGCSEHHLITLTVEASYFSYNDMSCACPECKGSGILKIVHPSKAIKSSKKSLRQGPFFSDVYLIRHPYYFMLLYSLSCHYGFSFDEPYEQLSPEAQDLIMYGSRGEKFTLLRPEGYDKELPNYLAKEGELVSFPGVLARIQDMYNWSQSSPLTPEQEKFFNTYMHESMCPDCNGTRLKKVKRYITLRGITYSELGKMEFSDLQDFFHQFQGNEMSEPIIDALEDRFLLMKEIGLEYLSFERRIDSLSGGEYQRLRIANQVGSGLVGLTYIIDEPTDGLHGSDNQKVIRVINRLLEKGNTVITIEHDYDVIRAADYIIEMGPGAGVNGGEVIAFGSLKEIQSNPNSIIGKYLSQKSSYHMNTSSLKIDQSIRIMGIEANNIRNVDIVIPLDKITCFTGVSGSGKSSIVYEVLYKAFYSKLHDNRVIPGKYRSIEGFESIKNIICIDQSLLNGKNTSIPATYIDIFDTIRLLFTQCVEEESEMKDCKAYFSFNSKGACPACKGKGYIESYIHYFGETRIVCSECNGQQYIEDVLQVKYHGKHIKQVLDMTFTEALHFFEDQERIYDKVKLVCDLGLGYMQLGQQLSTVSGGEAQRMKLAREMSRYKNKKNLLYIFDEPTIGLHSQDVNYILDIMRRIVANQNTVVIVEHNPNVILSSDYIIDMGPNSGKHGGTVMFTGTPSELLHQAHSRTADYLRDYVEIDRNKEQSEQ